MYHATVATICLHPVPASELRRGFCTLVLFISFIIFAMPIKKALPDALSCNPSVC